MKIITSAYQVNFKNTSGSKNTNMVNISIDFNCHNNDNNNKTNIMNLVQR